jgi:hypothetical protein
MRKAFHTTAILLGVALAACVGGSTDTSEKDKERLKAYVLDKAPEEIPNKLNINFDDQVTLIGQRIEPAGVVRPGQKVKLTMYWRADKKVADGWNLFTHVLDGSGDRILNIDNVGPLREWRETRQALPPPLWEPGKTYVDEQEFILPGNVKTDKIQVVVGIWKDSDRLKIKAGPRDRENRGIVANIPTGVAAGEAPAEGPPPNTRVPVLRVDRLEKGAKITIDGKLDEEHWRAAPSTGPLVDVSSGRPRPGAEVGGSVRVLWDDNGLYVGAEIQDRDVVGGFPKDAKDPHLWTKDTLEIMIDPDGDGDNKDYYEIQIGPQNLVFDSHFEAYNAPRKEPDGPFGHQDWSAKLESAVSVNGTLDKSDDQDTGYTVEAMIPWKSFHKAKTKPPKVGDEWRINFYAIQNNSGVAWSPILGQGNFHKASRFGRIIFGEKGWMPPGAPPALLAPPPAPLPPGSAGASPPGMVPSPKIRVNPRTLPILRVPAKDMPPAPTR